MSNLVEQATQYMSIGTVIEEAVDEKKILKDLEDMFKERKAYKKIINGLDKRDRESVAGIFQAMSDALIEIPDARFSDAPNFKLKESDLTKPFREFKKIHDDFRRKMKGQSMLNYYTLRANSDADRVIKSALDSGPMGDKNSVFTPFKNRFKAGVKYLKSPKKKKATPKNPAQKKATPQKKAVMLGGTPVSIKTPSSKSQTALKMFRELDSAMSKLYDMNMNLYNDTNNLSSEGVDQKQIKTIMKGITDGFGQLDKAMEVLEKLK